MHAVPDRAAYGCNRTPNTEHSCADDKMFDPIIWGRLYTRALRLLQPNPQPLTSYIFRPTDSRSTHSVFKELPMDSSLVIKEVQSLLRDAGELKGHTAYSIRRGRLQHDHKLGRSIPELLALGLISTEDVLVSKYLDKGRHMTASKQQKL